MTINGSRFGVPRASTLALTLVILFSLLATVLEPALAASLGPARADSATSVEGQQLRSSKQNKGNHKQNKEKQKTRGVEPEVIGGSGVNQGRYTFMAFVNAGDFQCGGSLVAPSFVMTAAHCATEDGSTTEIPASAYTIGIGRANLGELGAGNVWSVVDVTVHPDWDPVTFENDVAILELSSPVPAAIATPIPIVGPANTAFDGAGAYATVAGWGETERGYGSNQLLEASLRMVGDGGCKVAYGGEVYSGVMICATAKGKDSCYGDSGGPLFVKEVIGAVTKKKHKKGKGKKKRRVPIYREIQTGIVSWGEDCADPYFPGVYTRLSNPSINSFVVQSINS